MTISEELVLVRAELSAEEKIKAKLSTTNQLKAELYMPEVINSNDYEKLVNKPKINDVEVVGNKTIEQYGVKTMSNIEIKEMFDRIFGGNE